MHIPGGVQTGEGAAEGDRGLYRPRAKKSFSRCSTHDVDDDQHHIIIN